MRLLRYGAKGRETLGLLGAESPLRDPLNHVGDIAGVGLCQKPPVCVKGGEVMRARIDGFGIETQKVVVA